MKFIIKTKHFGLRSHSFEDQAFMMELNSDPEVVKYTGDKAFNDISETKPIIENLIQQYKEKKMGRFVVIDLMTGEKIGWCGLKWDDDLKGADLGYRFLRKHWNKGIATETGTACIEYAKLIGLKELYAFAMNDNHSSIHVLKKLGFIQVEGGRGDCDLKFYLDLKK